jgi:dolichol-phosphate mannosyltransferase
MIDPPVRTTVVVPTYNERDNLPTLTERIFNTLPDDTTELIVVDDNSPDDTAGVADTLSHDHPVRCLVRLEERGLATAVITGLRAARGDRIVVMDADLSHPPERIPDLLAALDDPRVAMAVGSRFVAGSHIAADWPWHRRLNSWVARMLARPLTDVRDMMSGFFAVRGPWLHFDDLSPIGYKIALELIVRHGWTRIVEVPITFEERAAGATKLNLREQWRYVRHLARLYHHAWFNRDRSDA